MVQHGWRLGGRQREGAETEGGDVKKASRRGLDLMLSEKELESQIELWEESWPWEVREVDTQVMAQR